MKETQEESTVILLTVGNRIQVTKTVFLPRLCVTEMTVASAC